MTYEVEDATTTQVKVGAKDKGVSLNRAEDS